MLGTAINGAVSSPVSGGVPLYRDTFLDPAFGLQHPELANEIAELRDVLERYVASVLQALRVHGKLCKDIAYHEALKSRKCPLLHAAHRLCEAKVYIQRKTIKYSIPGRLSGRMVLV